MLLSNAKGETATTIIMWLGGLIAVIILTGWFLKVAYPSGSEVEVLNENMKRLVLSFSDACFSKYYYYEYNPVKLTKGELKIINETLCIKQHRELCSELPCNTKLNKTISLNDIVLINITKNNTFNVTPIYLS